MTQWYFQQLKVQEEWRKLGYVLVVNKAVFTVLGKWEHRKPWEFPFSFVCR